MTAREAWNNKYRGSPDQISPLFQMTGELYDRIVCDPWIKFPPAESSFPKGVQKLPLVLAFLRKPVAGMPEATYLKDQFLLKTLHLLAQDL
jgi:hypothetical protein